MKVTIFLACATYTHNMTRYRLEIDVSDETAHAVIVMFDEGAEELVKCSAKALLEAEDEVSV